MRQLLQSLRSRTVIRTAAIICVGFWLTSTAYLAWAYTVMKLVSPRAADAVSLVAAYLFQAAGIGLFELFLRTNPSRIRQATYAALLAHLLCLIPAVLAVSLRTVLLFGLPMNLLCGWISGYYLYRLTAGTAAGIRAVRTFAEAALAYIGTSATVLGDVNWLAALSAGVFGFVTALLLALTGLPEAEE